MRAIFAAIATTAVPMLVGQRWIAGHPLVRWSLGAVIGIVLAAIGGLLGGLVGAPVGGATVMLTLGWFLGPRVRWDAGDRSLSTVASRVVLVLAIAGSALMVMSLFRPVPSWDAWFLWSLKAKGLASAGSFDSPVFVSPTYGYSSQDYPTLLPSWQAIAYIVSGDLSISWPLQFQQAWLWTASALALVWLTSTPAVSGAFLLPLAWVIAPEVVWQSMQGYADVPMALMLILGAAVLRRNERDPRAHALAGILLAGAALTKAEGAPLALIVLVSLLVTTTPTAVLGIGPAIVVAARLPWFIFTQAHGLTNDMINSTIVAALISGDVPFRVPQIVVTMASVMVSPLRWGVLVPACVLAAVVVRAIDARLAVAALLGFVFFVVVYQATWSFQGSTLEAFVESNVHRVLIAPIGLLTLSVASAAAKSADRIPMAHPVGRILRS